MAPRRSSDNLDSLREYAQHDSAYADSRRRAEEQQRRYPRDPNAMGPSEEVMERRRRARRHPVSTAAAGREGGTMTENLILLAALIGSLYALYCFCIHLMSQGL